MPFPLDELHGEVGVGWDLSRFAAAGENGPRANTHSAHPGQAAPATCVNYFFWVCASPFKLKISKRKDLQNLPGLELD
jgi:hypothetical protein